MIFENTTIFDFETTGLDPTKGATILEVGALRIRHGQVVGSYTELVNPAQPVPEIITKITGITDSDVVGCRSVEQVVTSLLDFMGDSLLIGYNVAFDLRFLHDYSPAGRWPIMNDFLDAQGMAIHALPYRSHKLTETCKDLGIELNGAQSRPPGRSLRRCGRHHGAA